MHLSEQNICELAAAYQRKVLLDDEQVAYKRHMAECDWCYNRFEMESLLQETLLEAGLLGLEAVEELVVSEKIPKGTTDVVLQVAKQVVWSLKCAKGKMDVIAEDLKGFWNFVPNQQIAYARGEEEEKSIIYTSVISPYSSVEIQEEGIQIVLDAEYCQGEDYRIVLRHNGDEINVSFQYDEEEEIYQAFIKGNYSREVEYELEIIEVSKR